jgi:hypothetical protein
MKTLEHVGAEMALQVLAYNTKRIGERFAWHRST